MSERTGRNPLVVPSLSTKVTDVSKQMSATADKQQVEISACPDSNYDADVTPRKKCICHLILVCQRSEPLRHNTEISELHSYECMCKARVFRCIVILELQVYKMLTIQGKHTKDVEHLWLKSQNTGFLFTEIQALVHRCIAKQGG